MNTNSDSFASSGEVRIDSVPSAISVPILLQNPNDMNNLFLQGILEAIPNPVFYKDTDLAFIGCNLAFSSFFGRDVCDIVGKHLSEIVARDMSQVSLEKDQEVIALRKSLTYETDMVRFDGAVRKVLVTKAPLSRPDGALAGIVGTFVDVTEQRELDELAHNMLSAVEQSPVSIVITDKHGTIEYVNPKFCQITGYSRKEATGEHTRILKSGKMPGDVYTRMWQALADGQEWGGELLNKRKNGELFWESATISPRFDKAGQITGYLAVKEDISARKNTEAELARSQQELQKHHEEVKHLLSQVSVAKREWEAVFDSLKDVVMLTDAEQRIRRCNKTFCEITGKSYEQVIGEEWRSILVTSGFRFSAVTGTVGEIINTETKQHFDLRIYPMSEPGGQVSGYVVSLNDTTEIRAVTTELQRIAQELNAAQQTVFQQEKLASIGQLAAGVAHEINNPMGFISSNLSTLEKYLDRFRAYISAQDSALGGGAEVTPEQIREMRKKLKIDYILDDTKQLIAESMDGAGRVRRIVQDLKSFSRVDLAECSVVDINEHLETTINIAWNEIKYIATLDRQFGDIPLIRCFPQQLNQVFLNLMINAAQAMKEQGVITVRTWAQENSVFISISDTGSGIPPEIIKRIFDPFFTTKEVGKGTGLGLSICYDIIRKHQGELSVQSEVGKGTTFTVRLPLELSEK